MPQANSPRVRIQDVAALSGLSICTVSRALRQLPNVSAQAKARVGDAAAQLGYKASSAAPGSTAIARYSEAIATQSSVSASTAGLHAIGSRSTANPSAVPTRKV